MGFNFKKLVPCLLLLIGVVALALTPSPAYASHQNDSNGNIILHYDNYYDYDTPDNITSDQVREIRLMRITQLDDMIQGQPEEVFAEPIEGSKENLHMKVNEIKNLIMQDMFYGALGKMAELREMMDGDDDDLIIDEEARKQILLFLDGIIYTTQLASQPTEAVSNENLSEVPVPSTPVDYRMYWYSVVVLGAGTVGLAAFTAHRVKSSPKVKKTEKKDFKPSQESK